MRQRKKGVEIAGEQKLERRKRDLFYKENKKKKTQEETYRVTHPTRLNSNPCKWAQSQLETFEFVLSRRRDLSNSILTH